MDEIIKQLRSYLKADAEHRGSAVQQIHIGRNGELRVELVDKVRAAELLSRLLDASALSPSPEASVSCPCETEEELDAALEMMKRYRKRIYGK
jgi:hypothetical protein